MHVALRKESVDRNTMRRDFKALGLLSLSARRAWIEINTCGLYSSIIVSLSARRAWIEIFMVCSSLVSFGVALRKESVDRNIRQMPLIRFFRGSLSARRAWIEIKVCCFSLSWLVVALRKESVDRNVDPDKDSLTDDGRSPQGERG